MDINDSIDFVYRLDDVYRDTTIEIGDELPRVVCRLDAWCGLATELSIIHYGSPGKSICMRNDFVMIYTKLNSANVTYLNKDGWMESEEEFFQFSLLHNVLELSYDSYKKLRILQGRYL